jgi:hypothetical protein
LGKSKLERLVGEERKYFTLWEYPLHGPSLRFVSGPTGMGETVKPGWWLNVWETTDAKRRFAFGSQKTLVFGSTEAATQAKNELEEAVDIKTEVVD